MSITDELREYANTRISPNKGMLTAIADRIDAEHERQLEVLYRDMSDAEYVELPKDADGVPWNVGERDEDGNEVIALKLAPDGWYVVTVGEWPYRPEHKRHYNAPTVEDVLREFTDAVLEWAGKSGTVAEVGTWSDMAAQYVAKLRLAEGEDA